MRIVMINSGVIGSTGNIMLDLAALARTEGHDCITACPAGKSMYRKDLKDHIYIGNRITRNIHLLLGKCTGFHGLYSVLSTAKFLKKIEAFHPNIIHLHNLHDCYINLPMLFKFIKKHDIKVVWTLHDCWSFTGGCPHFILKKCDKWKEGCYACPSYRSYPVSYVDRSKTMWRLKKKWFTGVNDLTIVTPSEWLAGLVKQSFLAEYPVKVINNGIDLDTFRPMQGDLRERLLGKGKYIVLGVAFGWGYSKGLDIFNLLAEELSEDYTIVLVGSISKGTPIDSRITVIGQTANKKELAQLYSSADVFVNPTRQDVFPSVNMEALACGTPVITFDSGGSPECVDESSGIIIPVDDIRKMIHEIESTCQQHQFSEEDCRMRAMNYNRKQKYNEYLKDYR